MHSSCLTSTLPDLKRWQCTHRPRAARAAPDPLMVGNTACRGQREDLRSECRMRNGKCNFYTDDTHTHTHTPWDIVDLFVMPAPPLLFGTLLKSRQGMKSLTRAEPCWSNLACALQSSRSSGNGGRNILVQRSYLSPGDKLHNTCAACHGGSFHTRSMAQCELQCQSE